jgi:aspartate/methionine/tyrosine aminotransferase
MIPIVGQLIQQHPGTISLGQGVVAYPPPPVAIARVQEFLQQPNAHKYQAVGGIQPLIEAITAKLQRENGIAVSPDCEIVVTAGSNMGFLNAILAITSPGDEVILQSPFYFNHEMAVQIAGCRPVVVATDEQYQLRLEATQQAITPRTRAIVTNSPNNPTGVIYSAASLRQVNELCRSHNLYHIHDEAYEYFTYDGAVHCSPGSFPDSQAHTISLFTLSKAYGFASWRIGYMVLPTHLLDAVIKIQDTNVICPPVISQYAALGALEAGAAYCQAHLRSIAQIRQIVLEQLKSLGSFCFVPPATGAFYLLLKLDTPQPAMAIVERLIREYGVATLPGSTFGLEACALRVAYGALQPETAIAGVTRLVQGLNALFSAHR